jgi:hypothetical protein
VEVKIGIANAPREIVLEIEEQLDTLEVLISDAVKKGHVVVLGDTKGRRTVIPGDKIVYVELGGGSSGAVGFR